MYGGKTDLQLMAASAYADNPHSRSIIFRRNLVDARRADEVLDRARRWWAGRDGIKFDATNNVFTWPSGSTVEIGHLEHAEDHYHYRGQWTFVGFEEAGELRPPSMEFIAVTRLRTSQPSAPPLRVLYTCNPGGPAHEWLRERFVRSPNTARRVFLPAYAQDNPTATEEYIERLRRELDPVARARYLEGNWDVDYGSGVIAVDKIEPAHIPQDAQGVRSVRFWDLAATPVSQQNSDPDWSVGLRISRYRDEFYIDRITYLRDNPGAVQKAMYEQAELDGPGTTTAYEQAKASAGRHEALGLARLMSGFDFRPVPVSGDKLTRAKPFAAAVQNGIVHHSLTPDEWRFVRFQLSQFDGAKNNGVHDDVVDACSGAYTMLSRPVLKPEVWA